ncbi:prolyl oligopeptidase family serine peptidase [Mangrovimonas sp. YM274]|uniref:prolyl oligopeptidase family serine peptidase n=1 Tax=Mangrovimonas sp. YM274 TaxID=3070660 RepID=UPI0027DDE643|nr:prolyl oligopeptidase family serine peptidase [Mangrovimonas sp. YM274]WMI70202.1 prolyl oligopeptidase family serine peptidase [Mangrovimonas sp. YM274]
MKLILALTLSLFITSLGISQTGNQSPLNIKTIMQGNNFVGHLPSNAHWSTDGKTIYFSWNPEGAFSDSLYAYTISNGITEKVDFETSYSLPQPSGSSNITNKSTYVNPYAHIIFNSDKSKSIYTKHGDIYLVDQSNYAVTQITNTVDSERNIQFTANDSKIAYVKNNNLFTWSLETGITEQITNFTNKKEDHTKRSQQDEWLHQDQLDIFEVLSERKAKNDAKEELNKRNLNKRPLEIYTEGKTVTNIKISPNGKFVTYELYQSPKEAKGTIVPHYVTESGYTEDQHTRTKVGSEQGTYEMFIYNIEAKTYYPVVLDNLEGLDDIPEYTKDYPDKEYNNDNRISYVTGPNWSEDSRHAVLDINSSDFKDRWIVSLNYDDGSVKNLVRQRDEAWIDGPGISSFGGSALGWLPDNETIWYMSEATGFAHLNTTNVNSGKTKALTEGKFEVYDVYLSNDNKHWYFTSNKTHPGDRQFYSMPLKGGKFTQLTTMTGNNDVVLSPNEEYLAILHSYSNKPTELYVQKNPLFGKTSDQPKQITHSTTEAFEAYSWRDPEIITFKAEDGATVQARLYQPSAATKNNAAIVFVHGAGYLQNAHSWWSVYFREYMFHNILADNGYTVLDIDYRGSAGYGRDCRTGIYRHMGGKDLSDQVDGVQYLINNYGIDKDKVGIYGGSYGGFITLMAMFNEADTFKAGAAIRSVGDWAAYNHGYTARILNTPVTDSLAYRRSSPIYFADGLKGDLLILHGMVDDNVHFQDMVRLNQRLIELEKHDWEMVLYPLERHGFVEPSSWTDEYTRIFNLFQESLLNDNNTQKE